jgi:V/A-type H+-transporting ATPase subunit I
MAVERMRMMNLVAPIQHLHNIIREVVMLGNVHIVNALHEVDESNFNMPVAVDNIKELEDLIRIKPCREDADLKDTAGKIKEMMQLFRIKPEVKKEHLETDYNFEENIKDIEKIYNDVRPVHKDICDIEEELRNIQEFGKHFEYLKGLDIDFQALNGLHFFGYKIGVLSRENRLQLKRNYENIVAMVLDLGSSRQGEVYLIISPKELEIETDRILRSLNFLELEIPREFSGTYGQAAEKIEGRQNKLYAALEKSREDLYRLKERYAAYLGMAYSRLAMEEELNRIKKEIACSGSFLYLSGWVPQRDVEHIRETFERFGSDVHIIFKETTSVYEYMIPPTKLKNNKLLKPFEALVKMYGVPSYNEADPTVFLSITYMLLFGAMFGDAGQGTVLLLTGFFARRKTTGKLIGGILVRLGISSIIFGFLYGSVFGFENIVPSLLIRPMININRMLLGSVVLGVLFLSISYGYGILNAIKQRDLKEGLFGRNGLAGLLFYLTLITLVINIATGEELLPNSIGYALLAVFMGLIVGREPLANRLMRKPAYEEDVAGYYIEGGFGIFETLLAMMSSTISFIRVGAFALNHVGLFVAFETMAEMTNSAAGSVLIYIVGNVVIIGLEGLIVFIQGLRLEYYEMFSRYYRGEGVEFRPARIGYL